MNFLTPFFRKRKEQQKTTWERKEKKLIVICPQAFLNLIFKKKCGNRENMKNPFCSNDANAPADAIRFKNSTKYKQ
jgi:hypothetical protein